MTTENKIQINSKMIEVLLQANRTMIYESSFGEISVEKDGHNHFVAKYDDESVAEFTSVLDAVRWMVTLSGDDAAAWQPQEKSNIVQPPKKIFIEDEKTKAKIKIVVGDSLFDAVKRDKWQMPEFCANLNLVLSALHRSDHLTIYRAMYVITQAMMLYAKINVTFAVSEYDPNTWLLYTTNDAFAHQAGYLHIQLTVLMDSDDKPYCVLLSHNTLKMKV